MSANVALVCIFSPKLWIILFEKEKNVRKQEGDMLNKRLDFIQNYICICSPFLKKPQKITFIHRVKFYKTAQKNLGVYDINRLELILFNNHYLIK